MTEEHHICELRVQLAEVKAELKATAEALVLARDNRHFMWALMVNFIVGMSALLIALFKR